MSVSCHETWEVLPALIRVSEEHKEQRRFFCVREKSQRAGRIQADIGGMDGGREGGRGWAGLAGRGCCLDDKNHKY